MYPAAPTDVTGGSAAKSVATFAPRLIPVRLVRSWQGVLGDREVDVVARFAIAPECDRLQPVTAHDLGDNRDAGVEDAGDFLDDGRKKGLACLGQH